MTIIKNATNDIPTQVFEKFLQALTDSGTSAEVLARLRKALIEDKMFTETVLKDAILSEELPA